MEPHWDVIVIGGGAAGFFAAIQCKTLNPACRVLLLERAAKFLQKVRISGGGRCNVTHACLDPKSLVKAYPRGEKELIGPFHRFQPSDTMEWFTSRGVILKTEEDGRVFPASDSSDEILECLLREAKKVGVELQTMVDLAEVQKTPFGFLLTLRDQSTLTTKKLCIATGSAPKPYQWLKALGHQIQPLLPSLFTFTIEEEFLMNLVGVTVPHVEVRCLDYKKLQQRGALLITHWGLSGPVILKSSAFGARMLAEHSYRFPIEIDWIPEHSFAHLISHFQREKEENPRRRIAAHSPFSLPRSLWQNMVERSFGEVDKRWADGSKRQIEKIVRLLKQQTFQVMGKSTFKQEFVTCGGVSLEEISMQTMESKLVSGLYCCGEVLDIDGITGGYNLQSAWTTGWIAGTSLAR